MRTLYAIYPKVILLSLLFWAICSMNGAYAQEEAVETVTGTQPDSLQFEPVFIVETEVTAEGDTIYHYVYKPFDLGEISQGKLELRATDSIVSTLSAFSAMMKVSNLSTGNAVGEIPFTEEITPSGGRTYSIPVVTAPVPSSAPQVALTYNSQSGNGVAGYGWNVAGLSAITLGSKNHHYDNTVSPIDLTNALSNALFIDGTRLVSNTGDITSYQYESAQGFILVRRNMHNDATIKNFTALYPDGSLATFGFSDNSENRLVYPLTSIVDVKGYRIDFDYITSGNNYYISSIRYGSRLQATLPARISFTYSNRTDVTPAYSGDLIISQDRLLSKIETLNNGAELRTYTLEHTLQDGVNLLTRLDCSVGASSLNPLTFEYGSIYGQNEGYPEKDATLFLENYYPESAKPVYVRGKLMKNKFNDGLITFPGMYSTYDITKRKERKLGNWVVNVWYEFGSTYQPDQVILIAPGLSFFSEVLHITTEAGFQTITAVDVNGDGVDEIVKVNFNGIVSGKTRLKITVYSVLPNGTLSSYSNNILLEGIVRDDEFTSPISRDYYFGDFKGDGKVQLLTVSHNKTFKDENRTSYFALINLEKDNITLLSENSLFSYGHPDKDYLHAMDINGDGKTELCYATASGYDVYALQANNTFSKQATHTGISRNVFNRDVLWGDINGDGKPDILMPPLDSYWYWVYPDPEPCPPGVECEKPLQVPVDNSINRPPPEIDPTLPHQKYMDRGNTWTIFYSSGTKFISRYVSIVNKHEDEQFQLIDVDKDGNADLVQLKNSSIHVYTNEKGVIGNASSTPLPVSANSKLIGANVVDYNAMSHFICIKNGVIDSYSYSKDRGKDRLLTFLTDSHGLQYYNYYSSMTDAYSNYYNGTGTRDYPYTSFIAPLNLLQSSNIHAGNYTTVKQYYYTWYGAVMHRRGLGFSGFEKVRTTEYVENITVEELRDPEMFGVTTRVETPYITANYAYFRNAKNKTVNPRLISSNEIDKLTGVNTSLHYEYDSYNNPVKITENIGTGSGITRITAQTYANHVSLTRYLLGQPLVKTVTTTRGGVSWIDKEIISYQSNYLPESRTTYTGTSGNKKTGETRWQYDINRNVISEKSVPYNVTNFLGNSYTYDSSGRIATVTNALLQTTTYSGYDKYGNAKTVKDHKNRITTREYDEWGRLVSVTYPDGTTETTDVDWGGMGLYFVSNTADGSPATVTHYDMFGREIRSGHQRFDGQWQYVDRAYDNKGRLEKVSLPFKGTSPSLWNTYSYDDTQRPNLPTRLQDASGRITTWSYNGLSSTETNNGIATTKTMDASGALVSVTDPGGTITYTLRPDGQPSSITAPGNVVTSFGYDDFGRQISIADPSAGTQTFNDAYATIGEVIRTVKDANNKTVTSIYDEYGRVKKIMRPEFNTDYTYDSDGLLVSEISGNGTRVDYLDYDDLDRIRIVKETVPDNKWLQKEFTYSGANMEKVEYSSQNGTIGTERFIYNYGHNTEIMFGTASIWKLTEENALGQPTKATTGSLERTYSYTAYGMPTGRTAGAIQSFTCVFDPLKGNLESRTDNIRNVTETFGYDHLNRLTNAAGKSITYAANGNITSMAGVGTMEYSHSNKPYQVSMFTPTGEAVPEREQNLTYTSFQRPATLEEGDQTSTFTYNAVGDRVRMHLKQGNTDLLKRYYIGGQYEIDDPTNTERLYLGGDGYSAPAVYVKEAGNWKIYYICRDYLGSITHVANADGSLKQELSYDAWGRLRNPATQVAYLPGTEPALFLGRGYTGHEHLPWFGLINMNARLYDAALGRFLSPDPYVQMPDFTQNFNRYSYALNNPLVYTDPNGEFIFTALLSFIPGVGTAIGSIIDAACWGAVIGAGTSAVSYGVGAAITGSGSWGNFWNSVGMGAVGGALGGGFSALGSIGALGSFGNTLGYSLLNQAASSSLTNTMFNNEITWGGIAGMAAGGLLGSVLPNFNAVNGGAFKNGIAEIGFNAGRGALTGLASGLTQAWIDKDASAIWQNTLGGAIGGTSSTLMNIGVFGAAEQFDRAKHARFKGDQPVYRSGGLASLLGGAGISWGRTAWGNRNDSGLDETFVHEGTHYEQQKLIGFANFYGRTIKEYAYYFFTTGSINGAYNINAGTLESGAMRNEIRYINLKSFFKW